MSNGNERPTWGRRIVGGLGGLLGGGASGAVQGVQRPAAPRSADQATPANPNVDPNDPQYRAGIGTRIMRGVGGFLGAGVPGVVRGATNPNAPGYFGRGAMNSQYYRDLYGPRDMTPYVNRPNVIPRYSGGEAMATVPNPAAPLPGSQTPNFLDRLNWRVLPPGGGANPGPWSE